MPRKPRHFVPAMAAHVVQRGNNRQVIFFEDADYRLYLSLLDESRSRYGCAIHTYVLMSNHVHLLVTPEEKQSVSRMMQYVGRHYVPYINKKYGRTGTLWEGRFKASTVDSSVYLLACYRYIEQNPVRAGMVDKPWKYPWSGYGHNALEKFDGLITPHAEYLNLGGSLSQRSNNYRQLFEQPVSDSEIAAIREYVQSGTPLGSIDFRVAIATTLSLKVGKVRRGRPKGDIEKGL